MDVIYVIWINVISIALLLLLLGMWKVLRRQFSRPIIFDLVAYFALLKILLFFLLPALLRILSDWQFDRAIGSMPSEIATVYTVEFISYAVWLLSILFMTKIPWFTRITAGSSVMRFRPKQMLLGEHAKLFLLVLCGLCLFLFPYTPERLIKPPEGLAYFIKPSVMMAGPVVAPYIFALGRKSTGNLTFVLGVLLTFISLTYGFGTGVRGQVVGPVMWLSFIYLFVSRKQYILWTVIAGIIIVALFQSVMLEVRGTPDHRDKSPIERIKSFVQERKAGTTRDSLLDSMEFRFGEASRLSVAFLRLYDSGMSAGLEPIKSALYAPLPRRFSPDKPEPGSIDGTKEGMGMYIIQDVMRGVPWNMSDFFTGVHAYWELGLGGVVLFSFLSALFVSFCANYFARFGLAGLPLMMTMLFPPWNEPKLWISQIILQIFHILIILVFIWYCAGFILGIREKVKRLLRVDLIRGHVGLH